MKNQAEDPRLFSFYLNALHELGEALAIEQKKLDSSRPLRESLYRVMGTFAIGQGMLLLWQDDEGVLTSVAAKGLRGRGPRIRLKKAQLKALTGRTRPFHPHLPPGGMEEVAEILRGDLEKYPIQWIVPISTGNEFVGLMLLGGRLRGEALSNLELDVLSEMASVLALRIDELRMRRKLSAQVRQLQRLNRQLRQIYLETVRALATVIDGPEEGPGHSVRVAALSAEMGRRLGLNRETCDRLYLAGLLHDIGKQIIGREILDKSAPLKPGERRKIEDHPVAGCELISHLKFPWGDVAEIIRHHHERPDGQGYPDGLMGEELSIEARILMMAEAFDSMTSDQPWRPRMDFELIVEQISHNLGLQFDAYVARALCDAVEAGLEGEAKQKEFIPHLEAAFDGELIRGMLGELRRQIKSPTYRPSAIVVDPFEAPVQSEQD